jgi:ribosomal protein S18 acetylase RimI-like enzyme
MIRQLTIGVVSRYARAMTKGSPSADITIRPAFSRDADGITHIYLESAEYHAGLDVERYRIPDTKEIAARYREGRQHSPNTSEKAITLVAEMGNKIVGFVDARLTRSPDPMHREMLYCHIVEIAVSSGQRGQGVGERLLRAAEDWGRREGAEFVSLEFLAANQRARGFYERLGYRAGSIIAIKQL